MNIEKIIKSTKEYIIKIAKIKRSPEAIALGFAVGCFVGTLPTFGFGLLIGFLIILVWPRINKFSLIVGIAIWNPLLSIPLYILSYKIGTFIVGPLSFHEIYTSVFGRAFDHSIRLLVGNLILSLFFSFLSYFIVKKFIIKFRLKREARKIRKKEETQNSTKPLD